MLADIVQEHDEPILKHLYDVKVIFLEKDPMVIFYLFNFIYSIAVWWKNPYQEFSLCKNVFVEKKIILIFFLGLCSRVSL